MNTQFWGASPAAIEQTLLTNLQGKNQQFFPSLQTLPNPAVALQAIDTYAQSLYGLIPQATWLYNQGFPRVAELLNSILQNLSSSRMMYYQMYQNALIQQSQMQGIWMGANTAITNNILAATNNQIRAFDNVNQDFIDFMEDRPSIRIRY